MRRQTTWLLVGMTLLLCSTGCASAPGLGALAQVRLVADASESEGATVRVSGRDCTGQWGGGFARDVTASHALENALDALGRSRDTVVYRVTSNTTPGPEVCVVVEGWVRP